MRSPAQATPNVTPLIDVMLVLLIIFMIVTPALVDGARIEPPRANHVRDKSGDTPDITLGLDAAGYYYLNKRPIDARSLGTRLRAIYSDRRSDRILYVKADRALAYGKVLAAVDSARNNGVRVIGMVTEWGTAQ
ncbi:MAG TPA: biopolymer transporter ExbD [Gemmatimonadaceae bacterium]|jgi:biopolymer transport protein ExbD